MSCRHSSIEVNVYWGGVSLRFEPLNRGGSIGSYNLPEVGVLGCLEFLSNSLGFRQCYARGVLDYSAEGNGRPYEPIVDLSRVFKGGSLGGGGHSA